MKYRKQNLKTKNIILIVVASLLLICLLFFTIVTTMASTFRQDNLRFVQSFDKLNQVGVLWPQEEEDSFIFISDNPIKILQISDVQLGGGWLTKNFDVKALNAIAALVIEESPDLVIFTGDISYCNPLYGASLNNLEPLRLVCKLMETLEVSYTFTFGNQDSERQCLYTRNYIGDFLESQQFHYCIFKKGPEDLSGVGNQVIKVKNTNGIITQVIICLDSNSYQDNKISTATNAYETSNYGYIKDDQIEWYKSVINNINNYNISKNPYAPTCTSSLFMHIPPYEMREAYNDFKKNNFKDSSDIKYLDGEIGEEGVVVHSSNINTNLFETALELGSTKAMFFGHDILNTFSLEYKGIIMAYSGSIDYFSKTEIEKYGKQRGCRVITLNPDGTIESCFENLYQEKYKTKFGKDQANLDISYIDGIKQSKGKKVYNFK